MSKIKVTRTKEDNDKILEYIKQSTELLSKALQDISADTDIDSKINISTRREIVDIIGNISRLEYEIKNNYTILSKYIEETEEVSEELESFNISGLKFVKTSDACPEQYDVYNSHGTKVAYIRLRFGFFTCSLRYNNVQGRTVYSEDLDPELHLKGNFRNENERQKYLKMCAGIINNCID